MKRIICILLILLNIGFLKASALNGTLKLDTDKDKVYRNEDFNLSLYMKDLKDLYAFKIYIDYDEKCLKPLQKTLELNETLLGKDFFIITNKIEDGTIKLAGTLLGRGRKIKGEDRIFQTSFKGIDEGITSIKIDALKLLNENGESLETVLLDKKISIEGGEKERSHHTKNRGSSEDVHRKNENVDKLEVQEIDMHKNEQKIFKKLKDVEGHWSEKYIEKLQGLNMIGGYEDETYKPDNPIKRAETAVLFAKALDLKSSRAPNFKDFMKIPDWSKDAIAAIAENNLLNGYEDGMFKPNQNMTRAELFTMIGKILKFKEGSINYKDKDQIPYWALNGVKVCTAYGIIHGDETNKIRPNAPVTRGETAKVLFELLEVLERI